MTAYHMFDLELRIWLMRQERHDAKACIAGKRRNTIQNSALSGIYIFQSSYLVSSNPFQILDTNLENLFLRHHVNDFEIVFVGDQDLGHDGVHIRRSLGVLEEDQQRLSPSHSVL